MYDSVHAQPIPANKNIDYTGRTLAVANLRQASSILGDVNVVSAALRASRLSITYLSTRRSVISSGTTGFLRLHSAMYLLKA